MCRHQCPRESKLMFVNLCKVVTRKLHDLMRERVATHCVFFFLFFLSLFLAGAFSLTPMYCCMRPT